MIIETIIGTLVSVVIAYLSYRIYVLKKSNKDLLMSALQATIDKSSISSKLQETVSMINSTNIEDKDGFIKFLSQSREWAFDYIENVQTAIESLDVAMQKQDEVQIRESYLGLLKYLPEKGAND